MLIHRNLIFAIAQRLVASSASESTNCVNMNFVESDIECGESVQKGDDVLLYFGSLAL